MRVLVVDDEPIARRRLRKLLGAHDDVEVIGEAGDGAEARTRIEELTPDLVLLDVRMPGEDGLAVAATLEAGGPQVVFTTAYEEHALRAFDTAAVDYLLKPIEPERLARALDRVRSRIARRDQPLDADVLRTLVEGIRGGGDPQRVVARRGDALEVFDPGAIACFVAADGYTGFRVDGRDYLLDDTIQSLEQRLASAGFVRVHRSCLVNLHHVRRLEREGDVTMVVLDDGSTATVSRRQLPVLRQRLGIDPGR